jgi:hypothetical protein
MAFDALLRECPAGAAKHWDAIMKILQVQITGNSCGSKDAEEEAGDDKRRQRRTHQGEKTPDPELQLAHLLLLETLLRNSFPLLIQQEQEEVDLQHLLTAILLPVIVWRAGNTRSTLRKVGLLCLYRLLLAVEERERKWQKVGFSLFPILLTSLDDSDSGTRNIVCLCLRSLLDSLGEKVGVEERAVVINGLIKRLDDPSEEVRRSAITALESLLSRGVHLDDGVRDQLSIYVNDPEIGESIKKLMDKSKII